jgi:sterol desaturase/sphingolipid hydroxylase (fatty acid hydroxylase superfamily)
MDSSPADTIRLIHYCLLFSGVFFIFGLENRYPLDPLLGLRQRLGHIGVNLGLWVYSLILVDVCLAAVLGQQTLLDRLASHGLLAGLQLPLPWLILAGLLVLDLAGYTAHYLLHRVPLLWTIHSVHHSDPVMDISSSFRFHPLEALFVQSWFLAVALVAGIPLWVLVLRNLIVLPLSLMHHANVAIAAPVERFLRLLVVSPGLHKIHHSPRQPETDSNYGFFLSIWDRLFGTLQETSAEGPRYGIGYLNDRKWQTVLGMLRTPWSAPFGRGEG